MKPASRALALWGWPVLLAVATVVGLLGGLWDDGGWDVLAWFGLGLPGAAALWFGWRGRASQRRTG